MHLLAVIAARVHSCANVQLRSQPASLHTHTRATAAAAAMRGHTPAQLASPQSSTHQTPRSSRAPSPALSKSSSKSSLSAAQKEMQTDHAQVKPGVTVNVCKPAPPKPPSVPPERNLSAKVEADVEDSEAKLRVLEAQVEALQKALQAVRSECSEQTAKSEALAARLSELTRSMQVHGSSTLQNEIEKSAPDIENENPAHDLGHLVRDVSTAEPDPIEIAQHFHRNAHFAHVDQFFIASCRR